MLTTTGAVGPHGYVGMSDSPESRANGAESRPDLHRNYTVCPARHLGSDLRGRCVKRPERSQRVLGFQYRVDVFAKNVGRQMEGQYAAEVEDDDEG